MKELRNMTWPSIAFVAVGVAVGVVIRSRGTHDLDTVNVSLLGALVAMVVLALAVGLWRSR
jgi:hypothetical protein